MKRKIILAVVGMLLVSTELLAHYQFGPKQTDYRRDLWLYLYWFSGKWNFGLIR